MLFRSILSIFLFPKDNIEVKKDTLYFRKIFYGFRPGVIKENPLLYLTLLAFMFFGAEIFSIFIPERDAYMAGGDYLLILGISQIFMMLELTTQGMFNGIGRTAPPAIISMTFNAIRIPFAMLLASHMGVNGVWWAISITTIFKGTILTIWYQVVQKKIGKRSNVV